MAELRIVVGGLAALLIESNNNRAAGVLLKPHEGHAPKHWPILLIPREATTSLPVIEQSELGRRLSQAELKVVGGLNQYKGVDVAGADIEVGGQAVTNRLTHIAEGVGPCPEGGDWTDLGWLIDMNRAHKAPIFNRESTEVGDKPIEAAAFISWTFGELRGHAPVERREYTLQYEYEAYSGGGNTQAFTDAFEWRADFEAGAKLTVKMAGQSSEIAFSGASSRVWLLNLPEVKTPSPHFEHTVPLPYPGAHPTGSPTPVGKCDPAAASARQPDASSAAEFAEEISVTITAGGPHAEADEHASRLQFSGDEPVEQLGDSMCMGRKLTVDRI